MAGAPGFEPGNDGTKNRCLTAWLRPKMMAGSLARKIAKVKVQLALLHNLAAIWLAVIWSAAFWVLKELLQLNDWRAIGFL